MSGSGSSIAILTTQTIVNKAFIDLEKTLGYNNRLLFSKFFICVKTGTARDDCYNLQKAIASKIANGPFEINGGHPRVVVEPSPQRKPFHDNAGKMLGFLAKKGVPKTHVKPEWGNPVKIFDIRGERPKEIANFDTRKGWSVFQGNLEALVPGLKVETVLEAMRQ